MAGEMTIHLETTANKSEVELWITNPAPHIPEWMLIVPQSSRHPFLTDPPHHRLERSAAPLFGEANQLMQTAVRLLAGEIGDDVAHREFLTTLTQWSRRTPPPTCSSEEKTL